MREHILKKWYRQEFQQLTSWIQLLEGRRFLFSLLPDFPIMKSQLRYAGKLVWWRGWRNLKIFLRLVVVSCNVLHLSQLYVSFPFWPLDNIPFQYNFHKICSEFIKLLNVLFCYDVSLSNYLFNFVLIFCPPSLIEYTSQIEVSNSTHSQILSSEMEQRDYNFQMSNMLIKGTMPLCLKCPLNTLIIFLGLNARFNVSVENFTVVI